jgi:SAM-dependent methyltransferase
MVCYREGAKAHRHGPALVAQVRVSIPFGERGVRGASRDPAPGIALVAIHGILSLMSLTPPTAHDAARQAYRGAAGQAYHGEKRAVPQAAIPWLIRVRAAVFQPEIGLMDSVIELGCGAGWNLAGLKCGRRVGMDVAVLLRAEVESAGIEFCETTAHLPPAQFDRVLCHHALEHVPDPLGCLAEACRLLTPKGRLLLAVPWEREARYRRFDPAEPNHHLFSWNVQTLGNLVTVAGLEIDSIGLRTYGYDRRAAIWAVRFGLGEAGFRGIRQMLQTLRPLKEVVVVARRGDAGE